MEKMVKGELEEVRHRIGRSREEVADAEKEGRALEQTLEATRREKTSEIALLQARLGHAPHPSPHPTPLTPPAPLLQERLRAVEVTASELSDFSSQLETLLGAVDSEDTILAQKLHKERGMASRVEREVAEAEARLDGQRAHRSALEARAEKLRADAAAAAARNQAELHKCDRLPRQASPRRRPSRDTPDLSRDHTLPSYTGMSATASRSRSSVSSRSATAPS